MHCHSHHSSTISRLFYQVEDLPPGLQDWYSRGRMVTVLGRSMFVLEQVGITSLCS